MKYATNITFKTVLYETEKDLIKKTDILLISTNKVESDSIFKYLLPVPNKNAILNFIHQNNNHSIGRLECHLVVHTEISNDQTNKQEAFEIACNAIEITKPKLIIMFGEAFGLNKTEQKIGDVLVSKRVINYDISKIYSGDTDYNPPSQSGKLLFTVFSSAYDWNHIISNRRKAKVLNGDLLSGEKRIDDIEFCEKIKKKFPNAIGGEMQGIGIVSACIEKKVPEWIVIKGISDWADGKKNKKQQSRSVNSVMSLLFHILSDRNLFHELNIYSYSKHIIKSENNKYILNAKKGSPLWTVNRLRSSLIPMLVKDLKSYEENGYNEDICIAVKKDLNSLSKEIFKLPKPYHGGEDLSRVFSEFINFYINWNGVDGTSNESKKKRRYNRNEMKKRRDELGKIIRLSQRNLNENLTEINTIKMFKFQENLLNKYPEVFPNFKRAVNRTKKNLNLNSN